MNSIRVPRRTRSVQGAIRYGIAAADIAAIIDFDPLQRAVVDTEADPLKKFLIRIQAIWRTAGYCQVFKADSRRRIFAPPLIGQRNIGIDRQRCAPVLICTRKLKIDKMEVIAVMRCLSAHGQQIRAACLIIGHIPGNLIRDGRVAVAIHICEYRFERLDRFCRPLPQYISIANRLNHRFKRSVCSFKRCELIVILVVVLDSMHNNLPRINRPADAAQSQRHDQRQNGC